MHLNNKISKQWMILLLVVFPFVMLVGQQDKTPTKNTSPKKTDKVKTDRSQTVLAWMSPNPDETGYIFTSEKGIQDIKVKAISNKKLASQDIKVVINNKTLDNSKFGEGAITRPQKQENNQYSHTFSGQLKLKEGSNIIEIQVREQGKLIKTRQITIKYFPERINLHVLAIGPKHTDLQFTAKDAKDFANAFKRQKNLLFKEVFIHTLAEKENTELNHVKIGLEGLKLRYENMVEDKINDKDLLILFISSHGREVNNRFKILTTGYSSVMEKYHTLDFEADILNLLKQINCKKLVFIDACNSGAIKDGTGSKEIKEEAMAKALHTLLETNPGLSTFTSCQKHELSYEDERWKNGAFTKAILAAFNNVPFNGKKPDTDGNNILELGELKNYIQAYVPSIVKRDKPGVGTQKPHVVVNELGMDFPIYALTGYVPPSKNSNTDWIPLPLPEQGSITKSTTISTNPAFMDSDEDGVSDEMDNCPHKKGLPTNMGCPEMIAEADLKGPANGLFRDGRDNKMYKWVRLKDGKKWMAQNLNYEVKKESWCLNNKGKNCKTKGRLYTWNASLNACPNGWRLPTSHDWENLSNYYGGEQAAFQVLLEGGHNDFAIQLGGIRQSDNNFCCAGEFGNYWTSESSISKAIYADFNRQFGTLSQGEFDKNTALSCRCIKE